MTICMVSGRFLAKSCHTRIDRRLVVEDINPLGQAMRSGGIILPLRRRHLALWDSIAVLGTEEPNVYVCIGKLRKIDIARSFLGRRMILEDEHKFNIFARERVAQ